MTEEQRLAPILEYIKGNLDKKLVAGDIARKFNLCPYLLSRLFNKRVGNFSIYIQGLRLDRAKKLLDEGATNKEACSASGFQSQSQFERAFKGHTGLTPRQYVCRNILNRSDIKKELALLLNVYQTGLTEGNNYRLSFYQWLEDQMHFQWLGGDEFKRLAKE